VLHPGLLHFDRIQGRNPKIWNIANDHAINIIIKGMIQDNTIAVPKDATLDPKYDGMSSEEIYDDLMKDTVMIQLVQQATQGQPGQGQGQPQQGKGKGQPQPGKGGQGQSNPLADRLFGDMRSDLSDSEDGKKAEKGDKGAENRINTDWKISLVAAAQNHKQQKGRGNLPAGLVRLIDELVNPKVHWLEQLSRWVGENGRRNDYSYSRPSRRSESVGQYLPSLRKWGIADVAVLMDTSGSISMDQLKRGVSEVQGVCEDLGCAIRAMVVDADLHDDMKIDDALELAQRLSGGGGSDFRPAFQKLEEDGFEGIALCFTDGDISVPQTQPPHLKGVMWAIYEGCRKERPDNVNYGETITIPKEEKDSER
jgi:predicted metal-dependent peptidase